MIAALGLSSDYRYVVAVAVSTGFLTSWQSFRECSATR